MKFLKSLTEIQDEQGQSVQPVMRRNLDNRPDQTHVEALLDAVVKAIPFVGYESSGTEEITDRLQRAFHQVAGMSWNNWKRD